MTRALAPAPCCRCSVRKRVEARAGRWPTEWGQASVFDAPAPHSLASGPIIAASEGISPSPTDKHCEHMTRLVVVINVIVTGSALTDYPRHMFSFWPALKCLECLKRDKARLGKTRFARQLPSSVPKDNPLSATPPPAQVRCFSTLQHCDCLT
jgi:hypothetical protein